MAIVLSKEDDDGLCCGRRDDKMIPPLLLRDAESPLGVTPLESAKSLDDLRLALLKAGLIGSAKLPAVPLAANLPAQPCRPNSGPYGLV